MTLRRLETASSVHGMYDRYCLLGVSELPCTLWKEVVLVPIAAITLAAEPLSAG